jgi:S1-C subfamily serine protease
MINFLPGNAHSQLSAAQNYARNRPGVVMVRTNFSATMYVNQVVIDKNIFNALLDSISVISSYGTLLSAEQKLDIVLAAFSNKPSRFFKNTSDYRRHSQHITTSGTGFFITEDGTVVTNCHVVDEAGDDIRRKFILSAFRQVTESNINALQAAWSVTFSDDQKELLYNTFAKVYSSIQSILLENFQKNIYVVYATDTSGNQPASKTAIAQLISKGQSMPGKDVAILKIENRQPLPVLRLADSLLPRIGDGIFVFGYPDPVSRNEYLSAESILEPSLTTGIVSGIRETTNEWNVVQMDADINHGNSGGPVCNEKGEVIGIATFGSIEYRTGALASGMNFSIPVNVLLQFLDSAGIYPKQGRASKLYNRIMDDYDNEEYRSALRKLQRLQKMNSSFPGLSFYTSDCKMKIEKGLDKTEQKIKLWLMVGGLLILTIGLVLFRRFLVRRKTSGSRLINING